MPQIITNKEDITRCFPLIILSLFLVLAGCAKKPLQKRTQLALGTFVSITIADRDKSPPEIAAAFEAAFAEIKRIEKKFSTFDDKSIISVINQTASARPLSVDEETFALIAQAKDIYKLTNGAFEVTVWPLVELWGFGKTKKSDLPDEKNIRRALTAVGSSKIRLNARNNTVALARGAKIDLSGMAKGYAVDRAVEVLKKHNISNALVDAGGDIYCLGSKDKNNPWSVGIRDPRRKGALLTELELSNRAVATSGDYERFFVKSGKTYSHIIDPRRGYPVDNSLISVTIFTRSCVLADALATGVFVLGKEKGLELVERLEATEAVVVVRTETGVEGYNSSGLAGKICLK